MRSHSWVVFAVCAGAPSCWNKKGALLNIVFPRSLTIGFILTPEGTKISGARHFWDIPAQTIIESGFWTLVTNLYFSGIKEAVEDNILSFCRLETSSTLNDFSSENRT